MIESFSIKKDLNPLIKLTIPLALTSLVQSCVYFFDTIFLAQIGQDVLAAGALVSWLFGTFVVIMLGTLSSINILIAHRYGAKDYEAIKLIVRDGTILGILLAFPSFLLFWNLSSIFLILGQSPEVVELSVPFAHALCWGLLPDFLMIVIIEFLMGLGRTRLILVFSFFRWISNRF